jgi:hypothetical protein
MDKALAAKLRKRKGSFHGTPSTTYDRVYAGEESLLAYPSHLRAAGLVVHTPFQSVTCDTATQEFLEDPDS